MMQRASAASPVLIRILLTFAVMEAPSLRRLVSVSGGYLARDERNAGGGGTVREPNGVHLGLKTRNANAVRQIRLG